MAIVNKQNKILFYLKGYAQRFFPVKQVENVISDLNKNLSAKEKAEVEFRVNYYNKVNTEFKLSEEGKNVSNLLKPQTPKAYYFDTYEYARYFPGTFAIDFKFGDINTILEKPAVCKSRPILGGNENNILLNLDKARHFVSVKDELQFNDKKNVLIGRAAVHQQHRIDFYNKYFNNEFCDLGQVNKNGGNVAWLKPKISIEEHLQNKFILSLEGNDVATNLKWIMSSNSIAVSPPLKMETWYMEGTLIPGKHFIGLNENSENLEDQIQYYLDHEKEAEEIIKNAKMYRKQFDDKNVEKLIALLVLKKYFKFIS